ncbi:MAG TPA: NAD(+)/NADH kinase [Candidatus Nesterenkonia stercoripullorum]|uniref:diacylglycerol kinase (ATP) n=1 Tax=Candidatus Nesterenkonia stercoripullorum TaxID=2838701 RepID=A0A9D1UUQ8_9MICC|nr:NAD(+)/NADH kinase [Candidatus Nesterenkonia stercoripullorum]
MTTSTLTWALAVSCALVVLLAVVAGRLLLSVRRLTREVAELDEAAHVAARTGMLSPQARRVALVINPTKLEAEVVIRLVHSTCSSTGLAAPVIFASEAEDAGRGAAREAVEQGADIVLAAGGDGTVRAVASVLNGTEVALGVIPLGTGNLFARNMGLPVQNLNSCVQEAIHGRGYTVDTVELELERAPGSEERESAVVEREISLVIAGGGLDAEVMGDTRDDLKERAGWLAYGEAGARHIMGARRNVTISLDGEEPTSHKVRSVLLANCGSLQAGMVLVPSAQFDDGYLDAVLFTPRHAWDWAKILAKTVTRFSAEIPVMTVRQSRRARITMEEPMPFQIDGDAVGDVLAVEAVTHHRSLIVNGVTGVTTLRNH